MSDDWWYRTLGQEFGPVDRATIRELLQQGTLDSNDWVRQGLRGEWVPVGSVWQQSSGSDRVTVAPNARRDADSLNSSIAVPPASQLSSAILKATQDSLEKQRTRRGTSTDRKSSARGQLQIFDALQRRGARVFALVTQLFTLVLYPMSLLPAFARSHGNLTLAILVGGLGIVSAVVVPQYWWTDRDVFEELQTIQQEFERLRSSGADDRQWIEFTDRVRTQMETIIDRLKPTANSHYPARLELLRVARDDLPAMLRDAREDSSRSQEQFIVHMQRAHRFIEPPSLGSTESDWLTPAIIAADVFLLIVAGVWYFRHRP